ncbi:MAG: hypothetical protein EAZ84_00120 [Verrucomicrobia bacterium]|nr:MAG: hypothetical protein EAZ84_00120 [Verrucomicrobiota bacterium]
MVIELVHAQPLVGGFDAHAMRRNADSVLGLWQRGAQPALERLLMREDLIPPVPGDEDDMP